ncbi:arylsulfatase [bacterium]|nr:arylsulfatase [bacterium]
MNSNTNIELGWMMQRRRFLQQASALPFAMAGANRVARAASDQKPPNIIFIMADDLGYGHLGCYGQEKIQTPCIDQLAAEGMRFTQCYAGAPVCAPSRSTLMTGLHGGHTPVRGNTGGIPLAPEDATVAEMLKEQGYTTALFGKWGLGEHGTDGVPSKQGFDEYFGWLHQIHAHFYYPEYLWHNDEKYVLEGNDGYSGQYAHDVIMEKSFEFLRKQQKNDKPFFLYLPLAIPHYELAVPEDSLKKYRGKFPETPYTGRREKVGYPDDYMAQPYPKAALAAMITRMDTNIGRLSALLDELGLDENTIIFFTSDNGPSYGPGEPEFFNASGGLRGVKASVFEGGIRVPMIARWKGKIQANSVSGHACYFPDLTPTFAELSGAELVRKTDGISITPTLFGDSNKQAKHDVMYWELDDGRAVRMGDWKAVQLFDEDHNETDFFLFNLKDDPKETSDVSAKFPDIAKKARTTIEREHVDMRPQIEPKPPAGRQHQ